MKARLFYHIRKYLAWTLLLCSLIGLIYNLVFHFIENRAINKFIDEHHLREATAKHDKYGATYVSDVLIQEFNVNKKTWKHLDLQKRPFFRNSVLELLDIREGACGEGSRVLIKILISLGYDATRISLYTKNLLYGHTLASVIINGKEVFVDAIGSDSIQHNYLKKNDVNVDFLITLVPYYMRYYDKITMDMGNDEFMSMKYSFYTYEAVPLNKFFNLIYKNAFSINMTRPSKTVSYIAESYYLIHVLLFLVLTIFSIFLLIFRLSMDLNIRKH